MDNCVEYADTVDTIRISHDTDGWTVDGINTETGQHTEDAWRYLSYRAAHASVPDFVKNLRVNENVDVPSRYEITVIE